MCRACGAVLNMIPGLFCKTLFTAMLIDIEIHQIGRKRSGGQRARFPGWWREEGLLNEFKAELELTIEALDRLLPWYVEIAHENAADWEHVAILERIHRHPLPPHMEGSAVRKTMKMDQKAKGMRKRRRRRKAAVIMNPNRATALLLFHGAVLARSGSDHRLVSLCFGFMFLSCVFLDPFVSCCALVRLNRQWSNRAERALTSAIMVETRYIEYVALINSLLRVARLEPQLVVSIAFFLCRGEIFFCFQTQDAKEKKSNELWMNPFSDFFFVLVVNFFFLHQPFRLFSRRTLWNLFIRSATASITGLSRIPDPSRRTQKLSST